MAIDWDNMLGGSYITLEEGTPKVLTLQNWRPQQSFKDDKTGILKPGIEFDVTSEDGEAQTGKQPVWTVTAKGAMKQLKPIIMGAEAKGNLTISISVVALGEGKARQYSIKETGIGV